MLSAFREADGRLIRLAPEAALTEAVWIDLFRPTEVETAAVAALGIEVPTLDDMEEIEISNRLYREDGIDYMTIQLTGHSETNAPIAGPVTFILTPRRIVTVRHHASRPFETYPTRADKVGPGCSSANAVFLSLVEEIVGRLADLLESSGRSLDHVSRSVYAPGKRGQNQKRLEVALRHIGREAELMGNIRLALLTLNRALGFYGQTAKDRTGDEGLSGAVANLMRDIDSLEVHTDFLSQRVGLTSDATLGMINLAQNSTVRIVSVVAVLFSPPTLIASIYGMNFDVMPELEQPWGYPTALVVMLASSAIAYLYFRWKNWL
ncbi:magnesium transporter CorA family protein [Rhodobacteraceae bacterium HSP-20]|uniref:Magnesium transporter CorA family protein n=1 Tax=Paragemmobacter amnigenus TaxID=2852097 RepID=A0ABS6J2E7_9RHOB|nr:magnesium transporter CorA family protein [Rhodobacter amnigenus]MBU9697926.1 magnesium transporter CorA family protein [Rhodobacter amnigenus]MBV4389153.1 magnesium transporter CorA family protein [Rhodobacter amnigenus]